MLVPSETSGMVYVHDAQKGITLPNHPDLIFAIMRVKGLQYKVAKDDRVMLENLGGEFQVGQQLVFDEVLMIGTQDYTSLGRPLV